MSYFFNVIVDDYDNLNEDFYLSNYKPPSNEKLDFFNDIIKESDYIKLRGFDLDDMYTFKNEACYYVFSNLKKIKNDDGVYHFNNLPLSSRLRTIIQTQDNLHVIFLKDESSDLNDDDVKYIAEKSEIDPKRYILIDKKSLDIDKIIKLSLKKIKNTFNVVYDNWNSDLRTFKGNLSNYSVRGDRYRFVEGIFRFYDYYNDIRNCHINEVQINKNENFYYFINCDVIHEEFKRTFNVPEEIKELHRKNKNFNIVLLNEHEFETKKFISHLDRILKNDNIDTERIYLWNNNSKLEEYKNEVGTKINVYSLEFLVKFISDHMINFNRKPELIKEKEGDLFLCHNRGPKPHRYALLCALKKNNILNDVDWSLVLGWYKKEMMYGNDEKIFYSPLFDQNDFNDYIEEIEYFRSIDLKKSKYEEDKDWFNKTNDGKHIEWKNVYQVLTYEKTYINIVTESCYELQEIHITEKSVKPFFFYQLPLFLSSYNHVKYLKSRFGFDMFDDLINHDYDNEPDNKIRFKMFVKEIERLHNMKDVVMDFYKKNEDRLIENHKRVISIYNSKKDIEYFNSLINKNL
jgi:hypothetical protein